MLRYSTGTISFSQSLGHIVLKCTYYFLHYVEIPAVQSQQQSPSVGNAKKKKVHIYAYTSWFLRPYTSAEARNRRPAGDLARRIPPLEAGRPHKLPQHARIRSSFRAIVRVVRVRVSGAMSSVALRCYPIPCKSAPMMLFLLLMSVFRVVGSTELGSRYSHTALRTPSLIALSIRIPHSAPLRWSRFRMGYTVILLLSRMWVWCGCVDWRVLSTADVPPCAELLRGTDGL